VSSIAFDHPSYAAGAKITATVKYVPGQSDTSHSYSGPATDSATGQTGQMTVSFVAPNSAPNPTSVTASDSDSRSWSKTADTGTVATFTAIA
jgi:hypothetical protein